MTLSKLLPENKSAPVRPEESPIKDFDTLLSELSAPTHNAERYSQAGQGAYRRSAATITEDEPGDDNDNDSFDPLNTTEEDSGRAAMDPEKAQREGRRMAKMVDSGLALGASLIAKSDTAAPYKASQGDIDDLAEAWSEVAQVSNISVNPWVKLAFLNGATYMPIYMKAFNDRRFRLMELEQEAMRQRQDALEAKLKKMENQKHENKPGNPSGEENSGGGSD